MPKAILANHMLHAAGLLFGGFGLYTGFHQQASEEAMFLVGLLRYFAAYIGQAEEEILICPHTRFAGQKNNLYNGKG